MKTDRELLELAAKAAGYTVSPGGRTDGAFIVLRNEHGDFIWNPLTDDGDALRMAVKLHMTVRCYMGNSCAQATVPGGPSVMVDETDHVNPDKATRRAIVRAAAAIGEKHD